MVRCFSSAERTLLAHSSNKKMMLSATAARPRFAKRKWYRRWKDRSRASVPMSVQRINRQAAEQLGIEVGGLLRQNFPGERDVTDLLDPDGIHQEYGIGATASFSYRLPR